MIKVTLYCISAKRKVLQPNVSDLQSHNLDNDETVYVLLFDNGERLDLDADDWEIVGVESQ